jgi:ADP-dependent NAD(P)H-hydrate dehydratase / NAD(P)H-hydrate epimerase
LAFELIQLTFFNALFFRHHTRNRLKIFSVQQIKNWDAYTISSEPIASIDLMERAAKACADWIVQKIDRTSSIKIICGKGNNGGDGLAIARLLFNKKIKTEVYIVETGKPGTKDFETNLLRLQKIPGSIFFIKNSDSFPDISERDIVIEALFGSGLNKRPAGIFKGLILHINKSRASIYSIDVPGGLFIDKSSRGNAIIRARYTLSFQVQKLAFLVSENEPYVGEVVILNIGLSHEYYQKEKANVELSSLEEIKDIYVPRRAFANKGDYGYACLVVGSYGMMGAAVLSAGACLRSGAGKLTCYICKQGYTIMQTAVPEAMCKVYGNSFITNVDNFKNFNSIGIGPGIGQHSSHKNLLPKMFKSARYPIVIDADALNMLSMFPILYKSIPKYSIITPHPKEFERLFGKSENDFERISLALQKAKEFNIFIVLKGHRTLIATPEGKGFFNSTGNAGMATAGSGDVLTGFITGLLAQKYSSLHSCLLGVYLHGLAGDIAAEKMSMEAMLAGDIVESLGAAFQQIASK